VNSDSRRCWRASKIEYRYRTLSPRALDRRAAPLSAARLEQGEDAHRLWAADVQR
jgi:hypothetical protein